MKMASREKLVLLAKRLVVLCELEDGHEYPDLLYDLINLHGITYDEVGTTAEQIEAWRRGARLQMAIEHYIGCRAGEPHRHGEPLHAFMQVYSIVPSEVAASGADKAVEEAVKAAAVWEAQSCIHLIRRAPGDPFFKKQLKTCMDLYGLKPTDIIGVDPAEIEKILAEIKEE